jgi:mannose/fructose/N-acetylgalactosamine-specific phosphotransferase system component IIC
MDRRSPSRRWPYGLLLVFSLLSLAVCYSGFAMAASFTVSNPEGLEHWRHMALTYLSLCGVSLIGIVVALIVLVRRSRRRTDDLAAAS